MKNDAKNELPKTYQNAFSAHSSVHAVDVRVKNPECWGQIRYGTGRIYETKAAQIKTIKHLTCYTVHVR